MAVFCLVTIALHVTRKNINEVVLYALQSLAVVIMMITSVGDTGSLGLLAVAVVTLIVKVFVAPAFFFKLLDRHKMRFSASTYINVPTTLGAIALTLFAANSRVFAPIVNIVPTNHNYLVLAVAALLSSILLMVNRKGTLSQMVGVLSLENSIVVFALLASLEQSAVLQTGIIFDVCVWMIIAIVLVSMVYRHTQSFDTTNMKKLRD
jgi:hydrogenase-4 membrane subunit HyfE